MSIRLIRPDPTQPEYVGWVCECRYCGFTILVPIKKERCDHCFRGPMKAKWTNFRITNGTILRMGKENMKTRPNQTGTGRTTYDPDFAYDVRSGAQVRKQQRILLERGYGRR